MEVAEKRLIFIFSNVSATDSVACDTVNTNATSGIDFDRFAPL